MPVAAATRNCLFWFELNEMPRANMLPALRTNWPIVRCRSMTMPTAKVPIAITTRNGSETANSITDWPALVFAEPAGQPGDRFSEGWRSCS